MYFSTTTPIVCFLKDLKIDESRFTLVDFQKIGYPNELYIIIQQASQAIDDIENGDPLSFTPMIMNKDDDVVDAHATV